MSSASNPPEFKLPQSTWGNLKRYGALFLLLFVFPDELWAIVKFLFTNANPMEIFYVLVAAIVIVLLFSIRQINQYERGVKFMLGKYIKIMEPGWRIVIPIFQSYQKVDMRVRDRKSVV